MKWDATFDGPLLSDSRYPDTKDPCPVYDGTLWHIFGSGGDSRLETWSVIHAVAEDIVGPWRIVDPPRLPSISGLAVAAPGVVYDEGMFHMFVQTDCFRLDGRIEYLVSEDGTHFRHINTSLYSLQVTQQKYGDMLNSTETAYISAHPETGIYDSHPAVIAGRKYIVYSGMAEVGRPDIYLAASETNTWEGPWKRMLSPFRNGPILVQDEVIHHNKITSENYEWGLEGAQLIELPGGIVLMNAVCFLPEGTRGNRQRVFISVADSVLGPYHTLGPLIQPPAEGWDAGENGHAAGFLYDRLLVMVYQARTPTGRWKYGLLTLNADKLAAYAERYIRLNKTLTTFEPLL